MSEQTKVIAENHFRDFIIPALCSDLAALEGLPPDIQDKFTFIPLMNYLNWKLRLQREILWDAMGEKPVEFSDKIIGGRIVLQVVFKPTMHQPADAKIEVQWGDGILQYDEEHWLSIWTKYYCTKCKLIKGLNCTCEPAKTLKTIDIGKSQQEVAAMIDDVVSGLVSYGANKKRAQEIVAKVQREVRITSVEQFMIEAIKRFNKLGGE